MISEELRKKIDEKVGTLPYRPKDNAEMCFRNAVIWFKDDRYSITLRKNGRIVFVSTWT